MKEPCPLEDGHETSSFDCGVEALNTYLKRYARQSQKREGARTYSVAAIFHWCRWRQIEVLRYLHIVANEKFVISTSGGITC